jgi:hypothetical protein
MRNLSILVTALALTACAAGGAVEPPTTTAPTPAPDHLIDLEMMQVVSCGDAYFYFLNDSATQMVTIAIPGLATRATEAAATIEESHSVGAPGLLATLITGSHLDQMACNDAIEFDPVVETELTASAGEVQVVATANLDVPSPMDVALTLVELTITELTFGEVRTESGSFSDLQVGWFAG